MIGRDAQLRALDEQLQLVRGGAGRVVFVAGEAGVGKSRLIREFTGGVRLRAGTELLQGHCYDENPAVPYAPFVDVIRSIVHEHGPEAVLEAAGRWTTDLATLLPDLEAVAPAARAATDPQVQKWRLFEAIYRLLRPRTAQPERIVVLEDIHWADQTSHDLLRYLARTIAHDHVLVLATYRSDELQRRHPLIHLIAQLTRERLYHEVRLSPLSRDELGRMLEITLERLLPGRLVDALYDHTGGNPFFVEEVLTSLIEHGRLATLIEEIQQGKGSDHLDIPLSVKDTILRRTADLDGTTATVLKYAAVIGQRFDFELLLKLAGLAEVEVLRAVEVLVERQLVVEEPSGIEDCYSFRHALTREAVYDDLLRRERRMKHREVLQTLEERYSSNLEDVVDQLAYHSHQARDLAKAAHYARLAGEKAARLYAYREAVRHYQVALDLLKPDDARERAELCDRLAQAAWPLGDTNLYLRYWREAQRLYEQVGDRRKVADIYRWLGRISWERGDTEAAFENVRAALNVLESEPPSRELAMTYTMLSRLYMLASRPGDSIAWGEKALRLAGEVGDEGVKALPMNNIGCSLIELGETQRGIEYLEQSVELAKRAGLGDDAARAYLNLGENLAYMGEFERAAELLRESITFAGQIGIELHIGYALGDLGYVEMERGHWEQAHELLDQAIRDGELGLPIVRLYALPWKGELLLRQGRLHEARQLLESILPECEKQGGFQLLRVFLPALARARLLLGDREQALTAMERCVAAWRDTGALVGAENMLGYGVEVYLEAGREDAARELLAELDRVARQALTRLAVVRLQDAQGLLALHEGRHGAAAGHFRQASALWQALGVPYDEARSRRRAAESLLQAGDPASRREARRLLTSARELFDSLGARLDLETTDAFARRHGLPPRPAQAEATPPGGLTPREREVIALLARGHSNREIAQALIISAKTAENHVSNILSKLGFTSRAQVVAYAIEHDLTDLPHA